MIGRLDDWTVYSVYCVSIFVPFLVSTHKCKRLLPSLDNSLGKMLSIPLVGRSMQLRVLYTQVYFPVIFMVAITYTCRHAGMQTYTHTYIHTHIYYRFQSESNVR